MMTFEEVLETVDALDASELTLWIEQRWIVPERRSGEYQFSEIDLARLRLICDFRYTFDVEKSTVPLLLSLLDQVYSTRRQLHRLADAVAAQPVEVRQTIFELFDASNADKGGTTEK